MAENGQDYFLKLIKGTVESFMEQAGVSAERMRQCHRELIELDQSLIERLRELDGIMNAVYESYRKKKLSLNAGKAIASGLSIGGMLLALYTNHRGVYLASGLAQTVISELERSTDMQDMKNNEQFTKELQELAQKHDQKIADAEIAGKNFAYVLEACNKQSSSFPNVDNQAVMMETSTRILSPFSHQLVLTSLQSLQTNGMVDLSRISLTQGAIVFGSIVTDIFRIINAINGIQTMEEVHPLIETVEKFISDLEKEINQLKNRLAALASIRDQ